METAGEIDAEAARERRSPADAELILRRVGRARQQEIKLARARLVVIAGDGDRRRDHQRIVVVHGSRAAVDDDVVAERSVPAGEGQVAVTDRDRAAGPGAESLAGPAMDGHIRLIVDLDIADDLAAVGDRADRGVRAGAIDRIARGPGMGPLPPAPPAIMPLLTSAPIVPEFETPAPPGPAGLKGDVLAPPLPPLIEPRLVRVPIVPEFDTPAPPAPAKVPLPPAPPTILPFLSLTRVVIASEFATPAPPAPGATPL